MIIVMFQWWYTDGWKHAFSSAISRPTNVLEKFSVPILLKTLFEPWKQIKSYVGAKSSFDMKMHAMLDNAFARTFGFVLRSSLIFIATLFAFLVFVFNLLLAIIWPIVPVMPIIFVILGLAFND